VTNVRFQPATARAQGPRTGSAAGHVPSADNKDLHLADIQRLLDSLNRLVDAGNTVLVIEHHLDVIKTADWIIDPGLEAGKHGVECAAQGTPEAIAGCVHLYTGQFLRRVLMQEDYPRRARRGTNQEGA
jgi:hypothetical protein